MFLEQCLVNSKQYIFLFLFFIKTSLRPYITLPYKDTGLGYEIK